MDVKFLKCPAVARDALTQKIAEVAKRGVLLSDLRALDDLDTALTLTKGYAWESQGMMLMGGRSGIVEQLRTVAIRHPDAAIRYDEGRSPLIVDFARLEKKLSKNKTIVQVCCVAALGYSAPKESTRVGDFLGTNVAYEVTLGQLANLLAKEWGLGGDG